MARHAPDTNVCPVLRAGRSPLLRVRGSNRSQRKHPQGSRALATQTYTHFGGDLAPSAGWDYRVSDAIAGWTTQGTPDLVRLFRILP